MHVWANIIKIWKEEPWAAKMNTICLSISDRLKKKQTDYFCEFDFKMIHRDKGGLCDEACSRHVLIQVTI